MERQQGHAGRHTQRQHRLHHALISSIQQDLRMSEVYDEALKMSDPAAKTEAKCHKKSYIDKQNKDIHEKRPIQKLRVRTIYKARSLSKMETKKFLHFPLKKQNSIAKQLDSAPGRLKSCTAKLQRFEKLSQKESFLGEDDQDLKIQKMRQKKIVWDLSSHIFPQFFDINPAKKYNKFSESATPNLRKTKLADKRGQQSIFYGYHGEEKQIKRDQILKNKKLAIKLSKSIGSVQDSKLASPQKHEQSYKYPRKSDLTCNDFSWKWSVTPDQNFGELDKTILNNFQSSKFCKLNLLSSI